MDTLLLDQTTWDLCLDASGHIALASEPYALAQVCATECRLLEGEYWYDTTRGVPYIQQIFGVTPVPLTLLKSLLVDQCLGVPDVASAAVFVSGITGRRLSGQVQVFDAAGTVIAATTFGGAA